MLEDWAKIFLKLRYSHVIIILYILYITWIKLALVSFSIYLHTAKAKECNILNTFIAYIARHKCLYRTVLWLIL